MAKGATKNTAIDPATKLGINQMKMENQGMEIQRFHGKGKVGIPATSKKVFIKMFWRKIITGVPKIATNPPRIARVVLGLIRSLIMT